MIPSFQMREGQHYEDAFQDIVKVIRRHENELTMEELLAIAASIVGQLIAAQDPTVTSPERVMLIINKNIEQGNQRAALALMPTEGEG